MITRLKQIEKYPTGDCFRTVMACLLCKENVTDVPNFMRDGDKHFKKYFDIWLEEQGLEWVEITWKAFADSYTLPIGYCGVSGKSLRGDYNHIVVCKSDIKDNRRFVTYIHDPSPYHNGDFIDGEPIMVGFLLRKLK
jgi:hypothetical protein